MQITHALSANFKGGIILLEHSLSKNSGRGISLRLPAKATIYYTLSSALAKAVGILTTPIFTRILSGEDYGKYTLYMSWLGLCTTICTSFVSQGVIYRGLEKFKTQKEEFIFSSFVIIPPQREYSGQLFFRLQL